MHHVLKILEPYWQAKQQGLKLFEIRNNDRGFEAGDTVQYKVIPDLHSFYESEPQPEIYEITFITKYAQRDNFVVFGERLLEQEK